MRHRIILSLAVLLLVSACQVPGMAAPTPSPTPEPTATVTSQPAAEPSTEEATEPVLPSMSYEGLSQEIDRSGAVAIAIGDESAPVTLVEYSDFSCPHCFNLYPVIGQLIEEYAPEGQIRVLLKPISFVNPEYSKPAAQAAVCAGEQGKGWEMIHEVWNIGSTLGPYAYSQEIFEERVDTLGLDTASFTDCFTSTETAADVEAVGEEAMESGVNGVPAVFLNDKSIPLAEDMYAVLVKEIEAQLGQ
jgi:protein-disulfide isomerase